MRAPARLLVVYALLGLFCGASPSMQAADQPLPKGMRQITTVEGMTEYRLENGLQVLLVPDASRPTVTVNLTVFVGSRHEGYGEAGMAHLLEHMVFKGTPDHPQVPKALQARGAKFNGTTWVDRTNYYETLPATADNLEFALRLEADRMINSFIKAEDLASEMTVVRNEFERGENEPSRILGQRMMATAYEWHNYGKSTIGNRSDIERVPVANLREFYKKYYQPDNAMVVVAGQFDAAQALGFIAKYFGVLPRPARKLELTYTEEPAQDGERTVTLRRVGDVSLVGGLYHIPSGPHADFAAVEVLENLLTSVPSGLLYKSLVETKKAASVSGAAFAWHDPGIMRIMAEVSQGNAPEVVLDTFTDTIDAVVREGVSEKDVERSKVQLAKYRELSAADTSSLAVELSEWAAQGDWRLYFLHRDRVEQVTADDVKRVAGKYLQRNNLTIGMFIPTEKATRTEIPATPDLKDLLANYQGREDQAEGEAFEITPENIEARTKRVEIMPGVQAALLSKKTRGEAVQVRMAIRYGTAESLAPFATEAEYLPELMTRGTKSLTREEIQDELDRNKARLSASGAAGVAIFAIQTKRGNLPQALDVLASILREPKLAAEELEVLKNRELTNLEQSRTDPRSLASRMVQRQYSPFPADDVRYVPTIPEEIERVQALQTAQLQRLYDEFLGAQAVQLSVVGDFDEAEVTGQMTRMLNEWTAKEPYARIARSAPKSWTSGQYAIETPDKANAVYYAGLSLALTDQHQDYPALLMGDFILGGGALSSRLGDRIRQKEGLSYGVGSSFTADPFDERGSLSVMAISNPDNIDKVNTAVMEELRKLIDKGPTADELARAKQGYLQRLEVGRSDDANLAQLLNSTLYTGRTLKHTSELEQKIRDLTPAAVTAALQQHITEEQLYVVTAGDFVGAAKKKAAAQAAEKKE